MRFERLHYLLAENAQRVRYAKGWTQEDAARAFREHGLKAWRKGTVGQFESVGCRFPSLNELLLICAALGICLLDLIPEGDDTVNLGDGMAVTTSGIRALLAGSPDAAPVAMAGRRVRDLPSDTDRHIARKLGVSPAEVRSGARKLWGREFAAERDARIPGLDGIAPRSLQARRGLMTRAMLGELQDHLKAAGDLPPRPRLIDPPQHLGHRP